MMEAYLELAGLLMFVSVAIRPFGREFALLTRPHHQTSNAQTACDRLGPCALGK